MGELEILVLGLIVGYVVGLLVAVAIYDEDPDHE